MGTLFEGILLFSLALGLAVIVLIVLVVAPRALRDERRLKQGRCLECGYDLRESKGRCPECGREIGSVDQASNVGDQRPE